MNERMKDRKGGVESCNMPTNTKISLYLTTYQAMNLWRVKGSIHLRIWQHTEHYQQTCLKQNALHISHVSNRRSIRWPKFKDGGLIILKNITYI